MRWLNVSVATIIATLQILYIYIYRLMNNDNLNHQFQRVTWRGREFKSDGHTKTLYIIQYLFIKYEIQFFSKNCKISQMQRWLEGYM